MSRDASLKRQNQRYRRTLPKFTRDFNFPAVQSRDALNDCEAQSYSAGVLRPGGIDAIKPVEHAREMLGRNADAVVNYGDNELIICAIGHNAHMPG